MSLWQRRRAMSCTLGAVFGFVYVFANTRGFAQPVALALRAAAVLAFVVVLVLLRRSRARNDRDNGDPGTRNSFGRGYWSIVTVEVVVGLAGAAVLTWPLDAPHAVLPWIALVVGVHFFPLGRLFGQVVIHVLGTVITACGILGLIAVALRARTTTWWPRSPVCALGSSCSPSRSSAPGHHPVVRTSPNGSVKPRHCRFIDLLPPGSAQ